MRQLLLAVAVGGGLAAAAYTLASPSGPPPQSAPAVPSQEGSRTAPDRSADEAAIRANVDAFVKGYNAGDAEAVAALFMNDGQIEDKQGNKVEGREAIAKTFADLFAASPKRRLQLEIESIRFIGGELAVEVGASTETTEGEPAEHDRYTVLHAKRDGKWWMAFARDEEGPGASGHERLQPLAWLVGEWVDDGGSSVVRSTCRWSEDGNFLLQEFKLELKGRNAMTVSQRIGWDPQAKRIRAWVFDSEGGFGESAWTREGDGWLIRATGVRPDGTTASATNRMTPTGKDGYLWSSTDRVVADETQPPVEIKVVRRPPQPKP